jgi:dTDP-glucose 4,6-dehydratase
MSQTANESLHLAIVGGAGFVGTNLALGAVERGHRVTLYDIGDRFGRLAASKLLDRDKVAFAQTDFAKDAPAPVEHIDAIIHLAALAHVEYSMYHRGRAALNNIAALISAMEMAIDAEVPLLFTSSVEVYGGSDGASLPESSDLNPVSPYAASKIGCEALVSSYIAGFSLSATTVRLTNLYGPWQSPDRVIPRVATQLLLGVTPETESTRIRDFVHVSDVVDLLLCIIERGLWGHTLNASSGRGVTCLDACRLMLEGPDPAAELSIVQARARDGRGPVLVGDPSRTRRVTGWRPVVALEEGIPKTAHWYGEHRAWWWQFTDNLRSDRSGPSFLVDHSTSLQLVGH